MSISVRRQVGKCTAASAGVLGLKVKSRSDSRPSRTIGGTGRSAPCQLGTNVANTSSCGRGSRHLAGMACAYSSDAYSHSRDMASLARESSGAPRVRSATAPGCMG